MAKHKLYRQFDSASPSNSSLFKEISPVRDVRRNTSDTVALVRYKTVKSKRAEDSGSEDEIVSSERRDFIFSGPLPGGDSASDSDSDGLGAFYRRGPKLPYSAKEDEWILKFVLKGQNVFKVGSLSLWKHLESKKENPKRTYQSLKNRFLRSIKPHLFTRYRHLITSETEIERVLAKFPELKCKVGRANTLSRIQLPVRNQSSKCAEGGLVNGSGDNVERVASPSASTSVVPANGSFRREPILNLHDFSNFKRKVTIKDKSLAVSVNFRSKKQLRKPVTPPIGIYETYKKFKKKNKLVLCSTCGRYNQPKKNKLADSSEDAESLNFTTRRDVLTANSLGADPGESSVTNSGSPSSKRRKVEESEARPRSPVSPSLLRDSGEELGVPVGGGAPDGPPETSEGARSPDTLDFDALCQEAGLAGDDQLRMEDDLDSVYDNTVTDFRKLIENEEERMLVRKCLYGRGGILGLSECVSPTSLESYFVELSPNLETPELTTDYSSQSPTRGSEGDNSNSLLVRNMMKMLDESNSSKES